MHHPPSKNRRPRGRDNGRAPGLRTPPPPMTGLEAKFYQDTIRAGTRVVAFLADGSEVRGVLTEFDRDQIVIKRGSDSIVIRKSSIRYIKEG